MAERAGRGPVNLQAIDAKETNLEPSLTVIDYCHQCEVAKGGSR